MLENVDRHQLLVFVLIILLLDWALITTCAGEPLSSSRFVAFFLIAGLRLKIVAHSPDFLVE